MGSNIELQKTVERICFAYFNANFWKSLTILPWGLSSKGFTKITPSKGAFSFTSKNDIVIRQL
jgi:hypothetical protein